jgi:hypothetical protein
VGTQFKINTLANDVQNPAVAADGDGEFVVVWDSAGASADTSSRSIQGQRYEAGGTAAGTQFLVNSYTTGDQSVPAVAVDGNGDFVVAWQSEFSSDGDTSNSSIQGQRYRVTGDVGDRVWLDRNFDGLQDAGEGGLAGIDVHLFDDQSTLLGSTTTDGAGLFRFEAKPGQYYVQFELPAAYSFTPRDQGGDDAVDSDADSSTGETDTFSVAAGASELIWDAGMANGVGDFVWFDGNDDGLQDGNELGIAGIVVELRTSAGALVSTTVTASDGRYSFVQIPPGNYYLQFLPTPGSVFSPQNAGADTIDSDVDPVTGATPVFAFASGSIDTKWDAGLTTFPTGIFTDGFESGNTSAWSSAVP